MISEFRQQLQELSREDLLELIQNQDPKLTMGINRIEWVFANKLRHLTWSDGSTIMGRPLSTEDLSLLIDEPFEPSFDLTLAGFTIEDQKMMHYARDPVTWAKHYLAAEPRVYQILMLRHDSLRKVLRAGRRLGKTWTMAIALLHYSYTHQNGRCVVVAPMKTQVELIYKEILLLASRSPVVNEVITRKVASPQYAIEMSNGSEIKFFTSGIKSGGKSDVVRGQEAHIIVLDEIDLMHNDDLESLYAMLQKTAEDQAPKLLMGASTPTGQRETLWNWCHNPRFQEFWFPSYCSPFWEKADEDDFHAQYTENGYRHEVEADWGEDSEGVYPRKYVDLAFGTGRFLREEKDTVEDIKGKSNWKYQANPSGNPAVYIIGVDWDKYGAGSNIVVLEVCPDTFPDIRFRNRLRMIYREEIKKDDFTLLNATDKIIKLNAIFSPKFIYVDKGFGEVQIEILHKHGLQHPETNLVKVVKGISFAGTIEVRDPGTMELVKKDIKPFMVDNLRQLLEQEMLCVPSTDDDLYLQLISYIVVRTTETNRPIFEAAGSVGDHIHDALLLAAYAFSSNYGSLFKSNFARRSIAVSNEAFLGTAPLEGVTTEEGKLVGTDYIHRSLTVPMNKRSRSGVIKRKMF